MSTRKSAMTRNIINQAIKQAFIKLDPRIMVRNPIMFVVEIGFLITLFLIFMPNAFNGNVSVGFNISVAFILLFTVLFANFAEALAEGRGKAQADSLKKSKRNYGKQGKRKRHQAGAVHGTAQR